MAHAPRAFSIRIFLPDGTPDGTRIVEKSNWTGCGIVIPRACYTDARSRTELDRAGVYLLIGPDEESGLLTLYVGEGDPIRPRIDQHAKNKDFWTHAVAFTSKDQNLNKAHVQHLESRLVHLATAAKRCRLDNGNLPQPPSLSEADLADVEGFLAEVLLCLPILGYPLFELAPSPPARELHFVLKSKGIEARGFEAAQGFVVLQGSHVVKGEAPSIHRYLSDLRATLIGQGVLVDRGKYFEVTQDFPFASPSNAAGVCLGRSANGRIEWKTADNRTLKEIQELEQPHHVSPISQPSQCPVCGEPKPLVEVERNDRREFMCEDCRDSLNSRTKSAGKK